MQLIFKHHVHKNKDRSEKIIKYHCDRSEIFNQNKKIFH